MRAYSPPVIRVPLLGASNIEAQQKLLISVARFDGWRLCGGVGPINLYQEYSQWNAPNLFRRRYTPSLTTNLLWGTEIRISYTYLFLGSSELRPQVRLLLLFREKLVYEGALYGKPFRQDNTLH